jgi:hypothetical protein
MTKLILFITILASASCSQISYSDAIPLLKNAIVGTADIEVDSKFIEAREYSFIKVKLGRSAVTIMTLSTISKDGIYKWVNASGESIYTYNGKIIKSEGIVYDMEMFNFDDFNLPLGKSADVLDTSFDTIVLNPRGFLTQSSIVKFNRVVPKTNSFEYEEEVSSEGFKWNFINTYQVDQEKNLVVESTQFIHPKYPRVEISFFYK